MIIEQVFGSLKGLPCWGVRRGHGSFLTLEFGEPHLAIREPRQPRSDVSDEIRRSFARRLITVRGQWHLWIYMCSWRVISNERGRSRVVGHANLDGTENEPIDRAARDLDGQKLLDVTLGPNGASFEFEFGSKLETEPMPDEEEPGDQFLLYEPSGNVFVYRSDGRFSYQPGDTKPADKIWRDQGK